MNSRERVLASINHKDCDYIPIDLGSNPSSGISGIAYNNLKAELASAQTFDQFKAELESMTRELMDVKQALVVKDEQLIDLMEEKKTLGKTVYELRSKLKQWKLMIHCWG